MIQHILIVASKQGLESPWEKHFLRSSAWLSCCTCFSWTVPGILDYICSVPHPLFHLPKGRTSVGWGGGIHVSDRGKMVPVALWRVCWGGLAHVLEFPNKNTQKNLSSHWCRVLTFQVGVPGACFLLLQHTVFLWVGTPSAKRRYTDKLGHSRWLWHSRWPSSI